MENEPNQEQQDATIEEIVAACTDTLPPEDLQDLSAMDPEEAYIYLLSYLPEFGVDDPDTFLQQRGLTLGFRPLTDEELAQHQGDYKADEIDYE